MALPENPSQNLTKETDIRMNKINLLKENGYDMDMEVITSNMEISDELIYIEYEIISTSCKYEFKIEMSEILWV